ncbi:MAG: MoaD/ThiS family protein [Chloroflexi bacterium]|nr:MoaD/ThiS family protein [Chloroflexota bacterium]
MSSTGIGSNIEVKLVLFADLRRVLPPGHDGQFRLTVPAGSTVADLVAASGLAFARDEQLKAGINGDSVELDAPVQAGDEVVLFSPMEGG